MVTKIVSDNRDKLCNNVIIDAGWLIGYNAKIDSVIKHVYSDSTDSKYISINLKYGELVDEVKNKVDEQTGKTTIVHHPVRFALNEHEEAMHHLKLLELYRLTRYNARKKLKDFDKEMVINHFITDQDYLGENYVDFFSDLFKLKTRSKYEFDFEQRKYYFYYEIDTVFSMTIRIKSIAPLLFDQFMKEAVNFILKYELHCFNARSVNMPCYQSKANAGTVTLLMDTHL